MSTKQRHHDIPLPTLSDEAAVEIHRFLEVMFRIFETRYGNQIRRYYDDRSKHNIVRSHSPTSTSDPPF